MIFMHNKQFNQCNHVDKLKNQLKQIPLIFLALHSKQFNQCNHVDKLKNQRIKQIPLISCSA